MKLAYLIKEPCYKCPYKLELIQTLKNPCIECKANAFRVYEYFQKQLIGEHSSYGVCNAWKEQEPEAG